MQSPARPLPQTFRLPRLDKTYSVFPDNGENACYAEVQPQSRAWIKKYNTLVCGPKMCTFLDNWDFDLLMSFSYPYAGTAGLRATMDLGHLFWLYDEYTDTISGAEALEAARIVDHALREPDYDDGTWICHIIQDFKWNHINKCGPNVARRFIDHFCSYTKMVGKEAQLREDGEVLDIPSYAAFRRESGGTTAAFDLVEYCLGLDLPQYVHEDPIFTIGYNAGMDLVTWTNDLVSYDMEQAKGAGGANALTVIMKSKDVDLQSAADFLGGYCESLTSNLVLARNMLASRADPVLAKDATRVLDAVGDWVRGNLLWSFTTERYFGKKNQIVKENGIADVRPEFSEIVLLHE